MNDEYYMREALRLARKGRGSTSPNPMVGSLIVKNNQIIGRGYHRYFGGKHAEVNAIRHAGGNIRDTTLYVTLEPCCHRNKKTSPCLDMLLEGRPGRVVIGAKDPNPLVNGKSIKILRKHGIETKVGVLEEECSILNEVYFKYIQTGMPFVTMKFAQTLDGRIASITGNSQWISSKSSRRITHRLRSYHDGIMTGAGTILSDDPQLTVRDVKGKSPVRIVADSGLSIQPEARVLQDQDFAKTIIATTSRAARDKLLLFENMGIEALTISEDQNGVDLKELLKKLGEKEISSIFVEGGAKIITSMLHMKLVDKIIIFIAPKIMGKGIEAVGDLGIRDLDHVLRLSFIKTYKSSGDLVVEANVVTDDIE